MTTAVLGLWPGHVSLPRPDSPEAFPRPEYALAKTPSFRILVTGWRDWPPQDQGFIHEALWMIWTKNCYAPGFLDGTMQLRKCIVVEGACPYGGVDLFAREWALQRALYGVRFESHPAETVNGRFQGPERNTLMVNLGADMALAFPGPNARGTIDCMKKIINANIRMITLPYQSGLIQNWRNTGRIEIL